MAPVDQSLSETSSDREKAVKDVQRTVRGFQARWFCRLHNRFSPGVKHSSTNILTFSRCAIGIQAIARGYLVRAYLQGMSIEQVAALRAEKAKMKMEKNKDTAFLGSADGMNRYGTVKIQTVGPVREALEQIDIHERHEELRVSNLDALRRAEKQKMASDFRQVVALFNVRQGDGCLKCFGRPVPLQMAKVAGRYRQLAMRACDHPFFDRFIMFCILLNCIFLALVDPTRDTEEKYQVVANDIFLYIFTVECITKLSALGEFYFHDQWNWIDIIVVVEGWVSKVSSGSGYLSGLKTLRILRPLRVANHMPSLKRIISAMLGSLPVIFDTFVVFFFFLLIFALICVMLWVGTMNYRCNDNDTGEWVAPDEQLCYIRPTASSPGCQSLLFLDSPYSCESGETCQNFGKTPNDGSVNFDNLMYALLTLFAVSTMEGWSSVLYDTQAVMTEGSILIFLIIILLGTFTIVNLMIAAILVQLEDAVEKPKPKAPPEPAINAPPDTTGLQPKNHGRLIFEPPPQRAYASPRSRAPSPSRRPKLASTPEIDDETDGSTEASGVFGEPNSSVGGTIKRRSAGKGEAVLAIVTNTGKTIQSESQKMSNHPMSFMEDYQLPRDEHHCAPMKMISNVSTIPLASIDVQHEAEEEEETKAKEDDSRYDAVLVPERWRRTWNESKLKFVWFVILANPGEFLLDIGRILGTVLDVVCYKGLERRPEDPNFWTTRVIWWVSNDMSPFSYFIQACIVFNLLVLAMDGHGIDKATDTFLQIANLTLTAIFTLEMFLKLAAIGVPEYCASNWNLFDGFIVSGSILELALASSGGSSLAALRVVRLLRLTRVARLARLANKWKSLRGVIQLMSKSGSGLGPVLLLLVLFMFIFSILGMQMFGALSYSDEHIRFDSFFTSFVQCFYVIIGEAWVDIMYSIMHDSDNPTSALYFVLLLIIGSFILVNLILAVVLGHSDMPNDLEMTYGMGTLETVVESFWVRNAFSRLKFAVVVGRTNDMAAVAIDSWRRAIAEHSAPSMLLRARELRLAETPEFRHLLKTVNAVEHRERRAFQRTAGTARRHVKVSTGLPFSASGAFGDGNGSRRSATGGGLGHAVVLVGMAHKAAPEPANTRAQSFDEDFGHSTIEETERIWDGIHRLVCLVRFVVEAHDQHPLPNGWQRRPLPKQTVEVHAEAATIKQMSTERDSQGATKDRQNVPNSSGSTIVEGQKFHFVHVGSGAVSHSHPAHRKYRRRAKKLLFGLRSDAMEEKHAMLTRMSISDDKSGGTTHEIIGNTPQQVSSGGKDLMTKVPHTQSGLGVVEQETATVEAPPPTRYSPERPNPAKHLRLPPLKHTPPVRPRPLGSVQSTQVATTVAATAAAKDTNYKKRLDPNIVPLPPGLPPQLPQHAALPFDTMRQVMRIQRAFKQRHQRGSARVAPLGNIINPRPLDASPTDELDRLALSTAPSAASAAKAEAKMRSWTTLRLEMKRRHKIREEELAIAREKEERDRIERKKAQKRQNRLELGIESDDDDSDSDSLHGDRNEEGDDDEDSLDGGRRLRFTQSSRGPRGLLSSDGNTDIGSVAHAAAALAVTVKEQKKASRMAKFTSKSRMATLSALKSNFDAALGEDGADTRSPMEGNPPSPNDLRAFASGETQNAGHGDLNAAPSAPNKKSQYSNMIIVASLRERMWLRWRTKALDIAHKQLYHDMIMAAVLVSTFNMLFYEAGDYGSFWFAVDAFTFLIFFSEVGIMVLAHDGWKPYLADPWNVLDLAIVVATPLAIIFHQTEVQLGFAACTVVRSFRPLRIINRVHALRKTVMLLYLSLSRLGTLCIFLLCAMTAYSVVGMQLLKGLYFFCEEEVGVDFYTESGGDDDIWYYPANLEAANTSETGSGPAILLATVADYLDQSAARNLTIPFGPFPANAYRYGVKGGVGGGWDARSDANDGPFFRQRPCVGEYVDGAGYARIATGKWRNPTFHFDDFPNSFLSVFVLSTEGWAEIVWGGLDATEVDYSPKAYHNSSNILVIWYFFFGVAFFSLYMLNLFIGVVFDQYNEIQAVKDSGRLLRADELKWEEYLERLYKVQPIRTVPPPDGLVRGACRKLAIHEWFTNGVLAVIFLNAIALAVIHRGMSDEFADGLEWANVAFAAVFAFEAAIKIAGLGSSLYFSTAEYVFDFVVTIVSILDSVLFISDTCGGSDSAFLRLVRSMRVFRLMRLVKLIPGCTSILMACVYPLKALLNVCVLLLILVFFFANVGKVFFQHYESGARYANFRSLDGAMQLLFILMTGDAWTDTMGEMIEERPAEKGLVVFFFVLYLIVNYFVVVNLFVMVVCEAFEVLSEENRAITESLIPDFVQAWAILDPEGSGSIPVADLEKLVRLVPDPLGVNDTYNEDEDEDDNGDVDVKKKSQKKKKKRPKKIGLFVNKGQSSNEPKRKGSRIVRLKSKVCLVKEAPDFNCSFTDVLTGLVAIWLHEDGQIKQQHLENKKGEDDKVKVFSAAITFQVLARRWLAKTRARRELEARAKDNRKE